jgi:hypothetical protein
MVQYSDLFAKDSIVHPTPDICMLISIFYIILYYIILYCIKYPKKHTPFLEVFSTLLLLSLSLALSPYIPTLAHSRPLRPTPSPSRSRYLLVADDDDDDDIPGGHARVHLHLRPALCHLRHRHRRQGRWATFSRKTMMMMMMMMIIFHDTNDCIDAKGGGDNFSVTMMIMIIEIMVHERLHQCQGRWATTAPIAASIRNISCCNVLSRD